MINRLLAMLKHPASRSTSADFEAALREGQRDLEEAERTLAEAREAYRESRLSDDPKASRVAKDREIGAEILLDRAKALVELAQQRLSDARENEAEAERRAQYATAEKAKKEAEAALRRYPGLARQVVGFIKQVAAAEAMITEANVNLPSGGTAPLVGPEHAVRSLLGEPLRVLSEKVRELWCHADTGRPVENQHLREIKSEDGRTGTFETFADGRRIIRKVIKRREVSTEYLAARSTLLPEPLSTQVNLPGLRIGEAPIWSPAGTPLVMSGRLGAGAEQLLERIAEIEAGWKRPSTDPRPSRQPQIEIRFENIEPAEKEERPA